MCLGEGIRLLNSVTSGAVYACQNMLYRRVKTKGNVKYLKCTDENCDGSAKIVDDKLLLTVCTARLCDD